MYMEPDERFRDWPRIREYELETGAAQQNVFAPGVHPVAYGFWSTTDYRDNWTSGDCTPSTSRQWRLGLLAQVTGNALEDFALKRDVAEVIRFENVRGFADQVHAAIDAQHWAFQRLVDLSVEKGILASEDAVALGLKCIIEIHDQRPVENPALIDLQGQFCTPASTADLASDPPN